MVSRVVPADNLFRFDRKNGAHGWPNNVEKESASYGDIDQALNNTAKENVKNQDFFSLTKN